MIAYSDLCEDLQEVCEGRGRSPRNSDSSQLSLTYGYTLSQSDSLVNQIIMSMSNKQYRRKTSFGSSMSPTACNGWNWRFYDIVAYSFSDEYYSLCSVHAQLLKPSKIIKKNWLLQFQILDSIWKST